jgi:uncharacterized protein
MTFAKHYLLLYETSDDYGARRSAFRELHLAHAWAAHDRGELVLAGALADPMDGAVLLFKGESAAAAKDFARNDPYVREGLITSWVVREWTTVVGDGAVSPVRPEEV